MGGDLLPWVKGPAPKGFRDGTHRLITPETTVERLRRLMPVLGITRVANVTGLDRIGIPVVMVCRPNARSLAVSQGKGPTLATARASGLMESLELHHAERITLPLKLASHNELRFTHEVVDVSVLPFTSVSSFDDQLQILWIEGFDLLQQEEVWLPYELVHMNCTLPLPPGSGSFLFSSNGLASGNHLLEAASHGICEAIERDASTLWARRSPADQARTRLDLDTVDDRACRVVLDRLEQAGMLVAVWEMTSDIEIACFRCNLIEREEQPWRPQPASGGLGCHPDRGVALLRALTEAVQSRLTVISGSRDDMPRVRYERLRNADVTRRVRTRMADAATPRHFHRAPSFDGDTFEQDVSWQLDRLSTAGFDRVVVVDLTQPGIEIPVVRVVIPGLEGSTDVTGWVPGRRALAVAAQAS